MKVLMPTNRNICVEEPKRPKILNKQRQLTFYEEFRVGKVLGKGRFGSVYMVQHNLTKFVAAVKQISLEKVSPKLIERLIYEIKIQSFVKHENIL
jgi:serine/threonine protein kinase